RDFHVTGVQTCALPIYLTVIAPVPEAVHECLRLTALRPRLSPGLPFSLVLRLGFSRLVSGRPRVDRPLFHLFQVVHSLSSSSERSEARRVGTVCECACW